MKRKKYEFNENHDRWLISYADFITLLFAFFVMMYAISSLNVEKYHVMSTSIGKAFEKKHSKINSVHAAEKNAIVEAAGEQDLNKDAAKVNQLLQNYFAQLLKDNTVNVRTNKYWTEIEIKSNLLFESGSAEPNEAAMPLLKGIANTLKDLNSHIVIEGYTDNVPIYNTQYPSNWELSTARSSAILRILADNGVDAKYLSATGYAEQHSIASNMTEDGRNKNRRVLIVIAWNKASQNFLDPSKRREGLKTIMIDNKDQLNNSHIDLKQPGV